MRYEDHQIEAMVKGADDYVRHLALEIQERRAEVPDTTELDGIKAAIKEVIAEKSDYKGVHAKLGNYVGAEPLPTWSK